MRQWTRIILVGWGGWLVGAFQAGVGLALPGQTVTDAAAWIRGNDTLRPAPNESLLVRRTDTASQRFTFQASPFAPGLVRPAPNPGIIRTEKFELFDQVNGISRDRLEQSLRAIYGVDIYQDYSFAEVVYTYPVVPDPTPPARRFTILDSALRGELRRGNRYAYWVEVAANDRGLTYSGQISVFPIEDLAALVAQLEAR